MYISLRLSLLFFIIYISLLFIACHSSNSKTDNTKKYDDTNRSQDDSQVILSDDTSTITTHYCDRICESKSHSLCINQDSSITQTSTITSGIASENIICDCPLNIIKCDGYKICQNNMCIPDPYQQSWVKQFTKANENENYNIDAFYGIATTQDNDLIVVGGFSEDLDLDTPQKHTSVGDRDAFVIRMDELGKIKWAKTFGSQKWDYAENVAVSKSGVVYIIGVYQDIADFDFTQGTNIKTATGTLDMFITKMDIDGNYYWTKVFLAAKKENILENDTSSDDDTNGVILTKDEIRSSQAVVDENDNVYITGNFQGNIHFDTFESSIVFTSYGKPNSYFIKLSSEGNLLRAFSFEGSGNISSNTIEYDPHEKSIYIGGAFGKEIDFDPGINEMIKTSHVYYFGNADNFGFILKLDLSGDFIFVKTTSGSGLHTVKNIHVIDESGTLAVTGDFVGIADLGFEIQPLIYESSLHPIHNGHTSDPFASIINIEKKNIRITAFRGSGWNTLSSSVFDHSKHELFLTINFSSYTITIDNILYFPSYYIDSLIIALDSNLAIQWVLQSDNQALEDVYKIISDQKGNMYLDCFFEQDYQLPLSNMLKFKQLDHLNNALFKISLKDNLYLWNKYQKQ